MSFTEQWGFLFLNPEYPISFSQMFSINHQYLSTTEKMVKESYIFLIYIFLKHMVNLFFFKN